MFRARQYAIFVILAVIFLSLFLRLCYLQILNHTRFREMADEQHNTVFRIEPVRGTIYDRRMEPLAINLDTPSIYADPRSIRDKERTARALSDAAGIDENILFERLKKDKAFIWVKRRVTPEEAQEVKKMGLTGVHLASESRRFYPNDALAAHMIGFAGVDNNGLEGLELLFNDTLSGGAGYRHFVRDARLTPILFNEEGSFPAENGSNVILTVDSVIQCIVEEEIEEMVGRADAREASVIVMEPSTGKILALANYPKYDLNDFAGSPAVSRKDAAISNVFEPGSVFKIVTASAALNEGVCTTEDVFDCENGKYAIGGRVLHDYHPYGKLSFSEVISKSSNIGTSKIARELGKKKLYEYIRAFGCGEDTGIDLPGEVPGISRPPEVWAKSDMTTIPIGQGIAVTPIQLACIVSVIANNGYLMKPYVVEKITTWGGETIRENAPFVRRRVLTDETCRRMREIMGDVVETGTGRRARSKLYAMCGKTGTAQMVNPTGGYYDDRYYATFIGFAPKEDPKISVIVVAGDPRKMHFGGTVAAPAFKNIAEKTLQYMGTEAFVRQEENGR